MPVSIRLKHIIPLRCSFCIEDAGAGLLGERGLWWVGVGGAINRDSPSVADKNKFSLDTHE